MRLSSENRRQYLAFLINACDTKLKIKPQNMTKYCAVLFFYERYLPFLESQEQSCPSETHDVQFNSLICLWIASKLHETPRLSIRKLQNLMRILIPDHVRTRKDIINAEIKLLEAIGFNISAGPLVSTYIEELLAELSGHSGGSLKLDICLAILDLLYLEAHDILKNSPSKLSGASILAVAHVLFEPDKECVRQFFTWLELRTNINTAELQECNRKILGCVPDTLETKKRAVTILEQIK